MRRCSSCRELPTNGAVPQRAAVSIAEVAKSYHGVLQPSAIRLYSGLQHMIGITMVHQCTACALQSRICFALVLRLIRNGLGGSLSMRAISGYIMLVLPLDFGWTSRSSHGRMCACFGEQQCLSQVVRDIRASALPTV